MNWPFVIIKHCLSPALYLLHKKFKPNFNLLPEKLFFRIPAASLVTSKRNLGMIILQYTGLLDLKGVENTIEPNFKEIVKLTFTAKVSET